MDRDNEIDLIQTIQEKDRRIKELEAMSENIGRELLARTDELNEVLEKQKNSVPKDKIRELLEEHNIEFAEDTIAMSEQGAFGFMLSIKELLEEE